MRRLIARIIDQKFLRKKLYKFMQYLYDEVLFDETFGQLDWGEIIDKFLRKKR